MKNIRFTDIWYPIYTDPNAKILHTLGTTIKVILHYAKEYNRTFEIQNWNLMHERYNNLQGMMEILENIGMISKEDRFRIPFIVYKTALKIACK